MALHTYAVTSIGKGDVMNRSYEVTLYGVRRGDAWLDKRYRWSYECYRHLWKSRTGVIRALNEADKIGIDPSDAFKVALQCPDTAIVAVRIRTEEVVVSEVPVRVKMKAFKFRNDWYSRNRKKNVENPEMAVYYVDKMPE